MIIERPTALQVAIRAWSGLFHTLPKLAPLFLVTIILLAILHRLPAFLVLTMPEDLRAIVRSGGNLRSEGVLPALGLDFAQTVAQSFVLAPAAVAMHRFTLLDYLSRSSFLIICRYAIWSFAIPGLAMFFLWILLFVRQPILGFLLAVPMAIGLAILIIKSMLLYPAVAVDERSENALTRLGTAFKRSEGIFWLTVIALVLALLPIVLVQFVVLYEFGQGTSLYAALGDGAGTILYVILTAAVASNLYRYVAYPESRGHYT